MGFPIAPKYVNSPKCDETKLIFLVAECFQRVSLSLRDPFCDDSLVYW